MGRRAACVLTILLGILLAHPTRATPVYVPRFHSHAEHVRPARVFAAFARGEMRRFTFESPQMQHEVERIIASPSLDDDYVNVMRGAILGTSRFQILRHLPADTQWYRLRIHPLLLASLRTPIAWNEKNRKCQTVRLGFRDLETRKESWRSEDLERYTGIYENARNVERVVIAGGVDFDDEALFLIDGNHRSLAFYSRSRMEPIPVTLYIGLSQNFDRDWVGNTYLDCLRMQLPEYAKTRKASEHDELALHSALKALDVDRIRALAAAGYTTTKDTRDLRNMTALSIAIVSLSTKVIHSTIAMGAMPINEPVHVPIAPALYMDPLLTPSLTLALHADRLHRGWATKLLLAQTPIPTVVEPTMSILRKNNVRPSHGTVRMSALRVELEPRLLDVVNLLLLHGADPNALDSDGTSVLINAGKLGLPRVAQTLLEKGAKCNITDANGRNALDHAEAQGHREFLQRMRESPHCSDMPLSEAPPPLRDGHRSPATARIVHADDANVSSIFFTHFVAEQKPLLVRGLVNKSWTQKWSSHDYLREAFGAMEQKLGDIPYKKYYSKDAGTSPLPTRFDEYLSDLERCGESELPEERKDPDYWFGKVNLDTPAGQRFVWDVETPFVLLDNQRFRYQADYYQMFAGKPGTGSPQHLHGNAWNALVLGPDKTWFFWPPGRASVSNVHPQVGHLAYDATLTATQKEGDVVFVPRDWGHATLWGDVAEADGGAERSSTIGFGVAAEFFLSLFSL